LIEHLLQFAAERPQVGNLAVDFGHVLTSHGIDCAARLVAII
jgi:hypothetical protein